MSTIKRRELRRNFLKSVIIRLDFQGVLESEMEEIMVSVKAYAKEKGFSKYYEKNANQVDIEVTNNAMPESIETTNRVRYQKVYSFIDEDRGFALHVSNSFIVLSVNTAHYTPFDEYCGIVPYIAGIFKDKIDFFTVTRFGIRKINECLIEDKAKIREYFRPEYFNYYDGLKDLNNIKSNHMNVFKCGKYCVNLFTNIEQGTLESREVYSIRLDIDVYMNNSEDISMILNEKAKQDEVNDLIFGIFVSLLTDHFISLLTSDKEFNDTVIMGVEEND